MPCRGAALQSRYLVSGCECECSLWNGCFHRRLGHWPKCRTAIGLPAACTSPGLVVWPALEGNVIPGRGCPGARGPGRPGPPASGPLCLLGPGPCSSRGGWGWRSAPFGVGMSPGCTGMPQGPPICVKWAIRARGARFSGPLPLVTLWPRTSIVRNPAIPARALLPRETDIRDLGALATEVQLGKNSTKVP